MVVVDIEGSPPARRPVEETGRLTSGIVENNNHLSSTHSVVTNRAKYQPHAPLAGLLPLEGDVVAELVTRSSDESAPAIRKIIIRGISRRC